MAATSMVNGIRLERLTGDALLAAIPGLAKLRVSVFADYPYLYDGDAAYEARYLDTYVKSKGAIIAGAFDGARLVGAATGTPMLEHEDVFSSAFSGLEIDLSKLFYCGESVLDKAYRGRGLGHAFFDIRETHAAELGMTHVCFCAVVRPHDHPARPRHYLPLDAFWQKRGYAPLEGVMAHYHWKDIGENAESEKPMQFWLKAL